MKISREDLDLCNKALTRLHYLANCYKANGHMNEDVIGSYIILQQLLNDLEINYIKEEENN